MPLVGLTDGAPGKAEGGASSSGSGGPKSERSYGFGSANSSGASGSSSRPYSGGGRGSGGNREGGRGSGRGSRSSQSAAAAAAEVAASGNAPMIIPPPPGYAPTSSASSSGAGAHSEGRSGRGGRGGRGGGRHSIAHMAGLSGSGKGDGMGRHFQPSSLQEPFIPPTGLAGPAALGMAAPFAGAMPFFPAGFGAASMATPLQGAALSTYAKQTTMEAVRKQIEYYFSVNNLCKDIFLRQKVTTPGPR